MIRLERSTHGIRSIDDKIIPMINVIFLLLMFFLIVGNLSRLFGQEMVSPVSDSNAVAVPQSIEITLSADGLLGWGDEPLSLAQLQQRVRQHSGADTTLRLRADARVSAARLLPVIEALKAAGATRIAIVTVRRNPRD